MSNIGIQGLNSKCAFFFPQASAFQRALSHLNSLLAMDVPTYLVRSLNHTMDCIKRMVVNSTLLNQSTDTQYY